jgi:sugar lactone lactonase YvrE
MRVIHLILPVILLSACYSVHRSHGGGQRINAGTSRPINTSDIALPAGYRIEAVASYLTFPTGIAFDEKGIAYVTEAGYSYGEIFLTPKLLKINPDGTTSTIASGEKNGPWNGLWYHGGYFYVSEGGELDGGKILRIDTTGKITALISDLPSFGDHHTNGPVIRDGYIYFGQGTATNSSVVGKDNYMFGWLQRKNSFHDIPCRDVKLTGKNYTTKNILLEETNRKAVTGSWLPYGTPARKGQVIKGEIPCSGSILRIPLEGGEPELVAWGFRNPYGLAFDSRGQLFVTENGYDDRGSRPVWGTGDYLWKVESGSWYGWPDYSGGHSLYEGSLKVPFRGRPARILDEVPGKPPRPSAILGVHSASNGFDFSKSDDFGFRGEAFIAQFGDLAPEVGKVTRPVGFKIIRVNPETGIIHDFVLNRKKNAPASKLKEGGIERPNAVRFSPDGRYMYIVDFGVMEVSKAGPWPVEGTGVIWRVSKK